MNEKEPKFSGVTITSTGEIKGQVEDHFDPFLSPQWFKRGDVVIYDRKGEISPNGSEGLVVFERKRKIDFVPGRSQRFDRTNRGNGSFEPIQETLMVLEEDFNGAVFDPKRSAIIRGNFVAKTTTIFQAPKPK